MNDTLTATPLFRVTPTRPLADIREEAMAATPPFEEGPFVRSDLADLTQLDPSFRLDIRYASRDNFLGEAVYAAPRALLQRAAARALLEVQESLRGKGFGVIVYDAYRPWYVSKIFWEAVPPSLHCYVADPKKGSRHNRGCAVDVGLYSLESGEPLEMPSDFDDFTERAHVDFAGCSPTAQHNRDLLRREMEAHRFSVYSEEWWHFDFDGWRSYPILNTPLDALP